VNPGRSIWGCALSPGAGRTKTSGSGNLPGAPGWALDGPLACGLAVVYLAMLAAWVPQYLSWPWWTDLDHFATFALAWDAGVLPYRDLPTFQFPGEYYAFWVLGKVFGWGRTWPVYAADAASLFALGVAAACWSRARFGRTLPGVVGYGWFLCYYLNLGVHQVAQRDWHAAFLATLGLFAAEVVPGRPGRAASALALAAAVAIRPHVVLLMPAFLLAIDGAARPPGGPWVLSGRAVRDWGAMLCGFTALAFAPLAVAGTLDDFLRGLREAAPGGPYNALTPATLAARLVRQLADQRLATAVACGVALLAFRGETGRRRTALVWLAAFAGAWMYRPLSPIAHAYLNHPVMLAGSVLAATLVGLVLEARGWSTALRAAVIVLVAGAGFSAWPRYVSVSRSLHALTAGEGVEFPRTPPDCSRLHQFYTWDEYRGTVFYLRRTVAPGVKLANALQGLPALTGPVARLPAFSEVSLWWFEARVRKPGLEESYIQALRGNPRSVVVWKPGEGDSPYSFMPRRLTAYIRSAYALEARIGTIEVWRRLPGT